MIGTMSEPDVLYVVKTGERNDALRLSLRSLANLPHRRVFITGYCPSWVREVTYIPVRQRNNKFDNIERNLIAGLEHPDMSENVVYMNDDFYITAPVAEVPVTHGGHIEGYKGKNVLKQRMRETHRQLKMWYSGAEDKEFYTYDGIHMPLPLHRGEALFCLTSTAAANTRPILWRTWYGNLACLGGVQVSDCKVRRGADVDFPFGLPTFLSTNNGSLPYVYEQLEEVIPSGSPYIRP